MLLRPVSAPIAAALVALTLAACTSSTSLISTRTQGYLYRVAMEKKGVYGNNGVPIEYARALTDTPARTPWDHDWKR